MPESKDDPHLEPEAIRRLLKNLGPEAEVILPLLIEVFLEETPRLIVQSKQAVQSGNCPELRRTAHNLKSNSLTFGANQLAELCLEIENRAKLCQLEDAFLLLDQVDHEYNQVAPSIHQLCHSLFP